MLKIVGENENNCLVSCDFSLFEVDVYILIFIYLEYHRIGELFSKLCLY